jgi:hypothetical protein
MPLVERALAPGGPEHLYGWFEMTKGMVVCRAGRPDEAIKLLNAGRQRVDAAGKAQADYFGVIAHHRAGRAAEAREAFVRGNRILEESARESLEGEVATHGIENWLMCQILRREAATIIGEAD